MIIGIRTMGLKILLKMVQFHNERKKKDAFVKCRSVFQRYGGEIFDRIYCDKSFFMRDVWEGRTFFFFSFASSGVTSYKSLW